MTVVRRAGRRDLEALLAVGPPAGEGGADRRADLTRAVAEDICLLVADDRAVCGFVVVRPRHFFGRDFIDLLVVAEDRRRRGLGRELVRSAVAAATSPDVFTSTNESNVAMQALLRSDGWSFSGKLDGLDEGDPELVYYLRR